MTQTNSVAVVLLFGPLKPLDREGAVSYNRNMIINHQILTDAEGRPVAAQIPWDEFEVIRDRLDEDSVSVEWRDVIAKRALEIDKGEVELVDGEDFLQRLRAV